MKLKLGDYVALTFLDHVMHGSEGSKDPVTCEVIGRVVGITKATYTILSWITEQEVDNHNNEGFTILRSTITKTRRLR